MFEYHNYKLALNHLVQGINPFEQPSLVSKLQEEGQLHFLFDAITKSSINKRSLEGLDSKYYTRIPSENKQLSTSHKNWLKAPCDETSMAAAILGTIYQFIADVLHTTSQTILTISKAEHITCKGEPYPLSGNYY